MSEMHLPWNGKPLTAPSFTTGDASNNGDYKHSLSAVGSPTPKSEKMTDANGTLDAAGRLPEEVYMSTLPWWRYALRRKLLECVKWESDVLAAIQVCHIPLQVAAVL